VEFILMLTRDDQTVADARALYATLAGSGIRHAGFKDVGIPEGELTQLADEVRAQGHAVHLEVVAESEEATLASARMAARLRPDYLLGGTVIEKVQAVVDGTGVRFFPYIGEVVGHPCLLRGSVGDIVEDARRVEAAGVDGINLLAYRYDGDVPRLVEAVVGATDLPVICAGSIESPEQVKVLGELGVWGFTIGAGILDRRVVPGAPLGDQVGAALAAASPSAAA
jgi:NAD(P)H-dependent flavin oxidoreductase YrpB (nitropropane dioxygenase family)